MTVFVNVLNSSKKFLTNTVNHFKGKKKKNAFSKEFIVNYYIIVISKLFVMITRLSKIIILLISRD